MSFLDGYTHYKLIEPGREGINGGGNKYFVFELGKCEHCGGPVQECNGVTIYCYPERLQGLKPWDGTSTEWNGDLPPEVWCGDDGSTFCEDCQGGECGEPEPPCCPDCGSTAGEVYEGIFYDAFGYPLRRYTCRHCGSEFNRV